ncbi:MAG: SUMF1/EgtB/PvdO family nonheme iron enzyme [Microcystaceae cyanobacterium]
MVDNFSESVRQSSLSDQATDTDSLGFEPYVTAIAEFLLSPKTKPPLTLSVEGEWGSGKSSFMKQLREYIEKYNEEQRLKKEKNNQQSYYRTVWFNAWRHDKAEAVWAAFALEFIKQISTPKTWREVRFSVKGYLKLLWLRFDKRNGGIELAKVGLLFFFVVCTALAIPFLLLFYEVNSWERLVNITKSPDELVKNLRAVGVFLLNTLGLTLSGAGLWVASRNLLKNLFHLVKSPTQNLYKYIESPDYKKKTAFIEAFHEDFAKIVNAYIGKDNKVFVFIDDLDRCEHPKSADLMQAINLMITNDPSVVFILGMDREKVAASLAVKYKDVLTYLPKEVRDLDQETLEKRVGSRGLAFGYTFIEKFVQLPFQVPQPSVDNFDRFLNELEENEEENNTVMDNEETETVKVQSEEKDNGLENIVTENEETKEVKAQSEEKQKSVGVANEEKKVIERRLEAVRQLDLQKNKDSKTVREIIKLVAPALDYNPRRVKAFVNVFRLRVYIAYLTGLFDRNDITLYQLGKFTAISLRWPMFLLDLDKDANLLANLCESRRENEVVSEDKSTTALRYWQQNPNFMALLTAKSEDKAYSLVSLGVNRLLSIAPRMVLEMRDDAGNIIYTYRSDFKDLMEMVEIPTGTFMMGSNESRREQPIHEVRVEAFQMGKYPVTQALYELVMGVNPSSFKDGEKAFLYKESWGNRPVETVSWDDAQEFCRKLSQATGKRYRLPTEAEWEYACRAGSTGRYYFGDDEGQLGDYAWYNANSNGSTHPVGEKKPNDWGLHDMHGNVWEWCEDDYVGNYENTPRDGSAYKEEGNKTVNDVVLRGGCWFYLPNVCRSASRSNLTRDVRYYYFGFRVVCVVGKTS